jgi:hypothetical protein
MTTEQYLAVHECEEVLLRLKEPCEFSRVKKLIQELDGEQEEESFFFSRIDQTQRWQQPHYAALQPLCDSSFSYCESIYFSCLLAEITSDEIWRFLELARRFAEELDGDILHQGVSVSHQDLERLFQGYISEMWSVWQSKPGDKRLVELLDSSAYHQAGQASRQQAGANKTVNPTADRL